MLERLRVQNYRGLRDLAVDELGRINVVAGSNNAGKTTLLEAIFLLGGAGNPRGALNGHLVRMDPTAATPVSIWETAWTPLFFDLDTEEAFTIFGRHSSIGDLKLSVALARPVGTEISRAGNERALTGDRPMERALKFTYCDPLAGQLESEARETPDNVALEQKHAYVPFSSTILHPGRGDLNQDAVRLGKLRKQKRGSILVDALRALEPRLQAVEDNTSSGAPMIWADIGLREFVPLPALGASMTHLARMVLAAATAPEGVVLVDDIENGLHHSVLPDVWRAVARSAEQFNVQVFATTHSFECVEAAHEALGEGGFRLHRLEAADGVNRCVTYSAAAIGGALRHNLEFR